MCIEGTLKFGILAHSWHNSTQIRKYWNGTNQVTYKMLLCISTFEWHK